MMGMGARLTPEQQAVLAKRVADHKAEVAALKEARGQSPDDGCGAVKRKHESVVLADADISSEVDEETVLTYIRTRQEAIEKLRSQVKGLDSRIGHLEFQLELSERKAAALRDALAQTRAELKEFKDAAAAKATDTPAEQA